MIHGSLGAEIWSSVCWMALSVLFLQSPPPPIGIVLTLLGGDHAKYYLIYVFLVAFIHALELTNSPTRRAIIVRKVTSALEAAAWTEILVDLIMLHQPGSVVLIGPLLVLLYVAIFRRRYYTWDIMT
jgi:hypothetical protein